MNTFSKSILKLFASIPRAEKAKDKLIKDIYKQVEKQQSAPAGEATAADKKNGSKKKSGPVAYKFVAREK